MVIYTLILFSLFWKLHLNPHAEINLFTERWVPPDGPAQITNQWSVRRPWWKIKILKHCFWCIQQTNPVPLHSEFGFGCSSEIIIPNYSEFPDGGFLSESWSPTSLQILPFPPWAGAITDQTTFTSRLKYCLGITSFLFLLFIIFRDSFLFFLGIP